LIVVKHRLVVVSAEISLVMPKYIAPNVLPLMSCAVNANDHGQLQTFPPTRPSCNAGKKNYHYC